VRGSDTGGAAAAGRVRVGDDHRWGMTGGPHLSVSAGGRRATGVLGRRPDGWAGGLLGCAAGGGCRAGRPDGPRSGAGGRGWRLRGVGPQRERLLLQQLGHCRVGLETRMDEGKKKIRFGILGI
jgi:hypothetical protein